MDQGVFRAAAPIILASGSPRRKELLGSTGVRFTVLPSDVDEPAPHPGETPGGYALRLARMKTVDVAGRHRGAYVLGADTVVALGEVILGKPADARDAERMLCLLAGQEHAVVTACCLAGPDGAVTWDYVGKTSVRMVRAGQEAIRAYVATGEPMDKAGAYAIQGQGGFLVESIAGSYSNVVGLPLAEVVAVLRSCGGIVSS